MKKHGNKAKNPNPFPKVPSVLREKHPEPMTLFRKREQNGDVPAIPLRKPEVTAGLASKAVGAMADWDNSDPFAYGRTYLHVKQGYVDPKDIVKDMGKRTLDRRIAKAREVEDGKNSH